MHVTNSNIYRCSREAQETFLQSKKLRQHLPQQPCFPSALQFSPWHSVPLTCCQIMWPLWGLFVLCISLMILQFLLPPSLSTLFDGGLHCFATLAVNLAFSFYSLLLLLCYYYGCQLSCPLFPKGKRFLCLVLPI